MDNVLEHLDDIPFVLKEIERVLEKGGIVKIYVPYYNHFLAYSDFTHKHYFTWDTPVWVANHCNLGLREKKFYKSPLFFFLPSPVARFISLFVGGIGRMLYFEFEKVS